MAYNPNMNKKILSILLSAALLSSGAPYFTYAVPEPILNVDTAAEVLPDNNNNDNIISTPDTEKAPTESEGPKAILSFDTAVEQNTEFGVPDIVDTATLSAEALEGLGTEESPYLITSKDELLLFSSNINNGIGSDSYYELTCDIDLEGAEWTPIGYYDPASRYLKTFGGVFDGKGHTVSNFKITKASTNYIGFFGYLYEATVKNLNLDNLNIDIAFNTVQDAYVGTLAGRVVTVNGNGGGKIEVFGCNVTNASLTVKPNGKLYVGGMFGSVVAGILEVENLSSVTLAMCNVDCDMNISAASPISNINVTIGGFAGYIGSEYGAKVNVMNCSSLGDVTTDSSSVTTVTKLVGGMFGAVRTFNEDDKEHPIGGEMIITSCFSKGDVNAKSYRHVFAGGFAGQISVINSTKFKDCYSTSNVTAATTARPTYPYYTVIGGFIGMTEYYRFSSENGNNTIFHSYSTGSAKDTMYTPENPVESYVGAFVGYTPVGIFNNCYKLESQVTVGSDISMDDIKWIAATDENKKESYSGFDFESTWEIDAEAEYSRPTLIKKLGFVTFMSNGSLYSNSIFGVDGKITKPSTYPEKASDVEKNYNFSHWSTSQDGDEFDFDTAVYENTTLYAVFSSSPREYKVNFISVGEKFIDEASVVYGGSVVVPSSVPTKEDEGRYYFEFSHWALTEDGTDCNPGAHTVHGDLTFYAVFTRFDRNMWTGNVANSFASGYGTAEMPYIIERAEELAFMQKVINERVPEYQNAHFALSDDINLGGNYWMPIGLSKEIPFSGHFNGNGYRILNYKVLENQYTGLFGYVTNATIKNVHLSDFTIDFDFTTDKEDFYVYVGGVAGYVDNIRFNGEISGIRVSGDTFNVVSDAHHVYAGGIVGYGTAHNGGTTTISNCFVTNPITVNATKGYAYVGGIAARYETQSASISKIVNCYSIGDISSVSKHSTWAGGLVGYVFSHGSAYMPSSESASLSAEDKDTMIIGSFVLANVSASSDSFEYVGYVVGDISDYAGISTVYYTDNKELSGKDVKTIGTKMAKKHFLDKDFLMEQVFVYVEPTDRNGDGKISDSEYDLAMAENKAASEAIWTYISGYDYPILKRMIDDKPGMKILSATLDDGSLELSIRTNSTNYTIVISVYSSRNQLIKFERIAADGYMEKDITYSGMENAAYVTVSALSNENFKPLFELASQEL